MPGGLLNLIAYGNQNVILNGNPSKTFFKTTYAKYTNFGLQKFRIDFSGQRTLRMTESSVFDFTVPRYGDLLMDTYCVVNLPNIWSPVMPPLVNDETSTTCSILQKWQPYEFKWIDNLGSQMIETVRFTVGGVVIQEFSGQYLTNVVERDFSDVKKKLYYEMTGNVDELNNPAYAYGRTGQYPSAFYGGNNDASATGTIGGVPYPTVYASTGSEPSLRARQLYIPLNIWFTLAAKMGFPLVSLQYAELKIEITIRPVQELFTVNQIYYPNDVDLEYAATGVPIQPNFNDSRYSFYRFLQSPPSVDISNSDVYENKQTNWNADIHLLSTYAFLTDDEVRLFASEPQSYLVRQSYTTTYENVIGSKRVDLNSLGMVSNWMWFFQRTDVNERNQWSNYSNWPYDYMPSSVIFANEDTCSGITKTDSSTLYPPFILCSDNYLPSLWNTGPFTPLNTKNIMGTWGLLLDGKYREDTLPYGVLDYVEKYIRTSGAAPEGVYCYNFSLRCDPFDFQPSGAMNMSKFSTIQFEVTTIQPTLNANVQFTAICNSSGETVATQMPQSGIYNYQYNMVVMEERYNVLKFQNGMAGLEYAR